MTTALMVLRRQRYDLMGLAVLWSILCLAASGSCSFDSKQTRESLWLLAGVVVAVEDLAPDAEQAGLIRTQIQTDVELRLRQAGIPVLDTPGLAALGVRVATLKDDTGLFAYTIDVALFQLVLVEHNYTRVSIPTWGTSFIGMVGARKLPTIRNVIRDLVDQFINAYLAVNPRPPGSATPSSASPRRALIRQVQERLQAAGFTTGAIDGALGPQTRNALRSFQNTQGLQATGELDEVTLDALGVR